MGRQVNLASPRLLRAIWLTAAFFLMSTPATLAGAPGAASTPLASQLELAAFQQKLTEATVDYDGVRLRQLIAQLEALPASRQSAATTLLLGQAYEYVSELCLLEDRREAERLAATAVKHLRAALAQGESSAAHSALAHSYQIMTFAKKLNGPLLGPKTSQSIKRALELDPSSFQALLLEAEGFLDPPPLFGGDLNKAIDILTGLSQQFADSDRVFYNLGRAYVKAKDNTRAKKALEQALKLNPKNPFARRLLAELS